MKMLSVSNKPFTDTKPSQPLQDVTDDYYKDLRRPRRVTFFKNGDRYFAGKTLMITPNRYITFRELMADLNRSVDLPYGVRRVFTPTTGREIHDIEDLVDGSSYVCGSFEPFRGVEYVHPHRHDINGPHMHTSTAAQLLPQFTSSYGQNSTNGGIGVGGVTNGTANFINSQGYYIPRQYVRTFPGAKRTTYGAQYNKQLAASEAWSKPRLVTVVKAGEKPRKKVSILLNRKAIHSFEQFVCDISDAFGLPQWRNDKIRKLYTLKGRRVQGISDFFRDDNVFIAVSGKELLTTSMVQDLLEDLYPDSPYSQNLLKEWEKARKAPNSTLDNSSVTNKSTHRDSGLGEDDGSTDHADQQQQQQQQTQQQQRRKDLNDSKDSRDSKLPLTDENGKKKKKKKKDHEIILEIENQRQKDRIRLIEEERKKREGMPPVIINNIDPQQQQQQQSKYGPTYITVVKHGSVPNENNNNNLPTIGTPQDPKKIKRKPKIRKSVLGQSDDESNNNTKNATPSGVVPIITEEIPSKSPAGVQLPKIVGEKKDNDDNTKENKENKNNHPKIKKLKRQISNAKYIYDRYEMLKQLGDGNFAVVKQAKLRTTDNEYAIKIIDKSKMKGKEHMIENEIHIMKSCNHPNIVKLYEEFETPDEVYLVTDLVKGGDLFDAISQSIKFNEKDSAGMVKDLAEALFYLHSKNIVHRDLKPENLLVLRRKDGSISIKLADFGLAMEVKVPIFTVCGTPTYVAPEILAETGYGLEVDMWACGVITYILLCGFPPFRSLDRNQEELFQYIQAGEFEYLMPYWEGISESSKDLINHLLVVDVKKRYKAEDVLVHPWIVTHGNSKELPSNFDEHRKELLSELKVKAKQYAAEPFFRM